MPRPWFQKRRQILDCCHLSKSSFSRLRNDNDHGKFLEGRIIILFCPSGRGQPTQGDPRPRRGGSPGAVGGAEGVPGAAAEAEAGAKRRGGEGGARGGGGGQRKGVRRPAAGDIRGGERLQEAGGRRGGKIHFACFRVHNSYFSPPGDPPRHLARLPLPPAPHPRCGATKELPGGDGADDGQRSHVEVPHRQRAGH